MRTREECIEYCEMFLNTLAKIKSEDIDYLTSMIQYLTVPEETFCYDKYDIRIDADERKGHLCCSLHRLEDEFRTLAQEVRKKGEMFYVLGDADFADRIADYFCRAEATIWYLRGQCNINLSEENQNGTN